jgi:hypothetical protein
MDGVGKYRRLTATGNVPPHLDGGTCWGGYLTPGAATATVTLREGGSGGTVIAVFSALTSGDSVPIPGPFRFDGVLHATLSGAGAEVGLLV